MIPYMHIWDRCTLINWSVTIQVLMYVREPSCGILTQPLGYGANDMKFRSTMLQELVESQSTEAAHRQKLYYNRTSCKQCFKIRYVMWLSILVVENYTLIEMEEYGGVKSMKTPLTVEITDGVKTKVHHYVNYCA